MDTEFDEFLAEYKDQPGILALLWAEKIHWTQHELCLVDKDSCIVCHDS